MVNCCDTSFPNVSELSPPATVTFPVSVPVFSPPTVIVFPANNNLCAPPPWTFVILPSIFSAAEFVPLDVPLLSAIIETCPFTPVAPTTTSPPWTSVATPAITLPPISIESPAVNDVVALPNCSTPPVTDTPPVTATPPVSDCKLIVPPLAAIDPMDNAVPFESDAVKLIASVPIVPLLINAPAMVTSWALIFVIPELFVTLPAISIEPALVDACTVSVPPFVLTKSPLPVTSASPITTFPPPNICMVYAFVTSPCTITSVAACTVVLRPPAPTSGLVASATTSP